MKKKICRNEWFGMIFNVQTLQKLRERENENISNHVKKKLSHFPYLQLQATSNIYIPFICGLSSSSFNI
jgi:hypothetical protein